MNIYDVLRRLVEARQFQDYERVEAITLIGDLEQANVLGTMARLIREEHEHDWYNLNSRRRKCRLCPTEEDI